jgi:uncharacterized LabA/DUF88 family protein
MVRRSRRRSSPTRQVVRKVSAPRFLKGAAPDHAPLSDDWVHIFVDDQNLFWGIVNEELGPGFRIDFGNLLLEACRTIGGKSRAIGSAYIAGVIPDDDSFWKIAQNQGFIVRRGYLGSNNRSKQDDAYLVTDMTATLFERPGPSTIVLVAGDADYVPPLKKALEKGWRTEIAFTNRSISKSLEHVVHEFRTIRAADIQYDPR